MTKFLPSYKRFRVSYSSPFHFEENISTGSLLMIAAMILISGLILVVMISIVGQTQAPADQILSYEETAVLGASTQAQSEHSRLEKLAKFFNWVR